MSTSVPLEWLTGEEPKVDVGKVAMESLQSLTPLIVVAVGAARVAWDMTGDIRGSNGKVSTKALPNDLRLAVTQSIVTTITEVVLGNAIARSQT